MRRACVAVMVLAALVFYGAPAGADPTALHEAAAPSLASFGDDGVCTAVPDTLPGIFDFTEACQAHDACYAAGIDRRACDVAFREDMIAACQVQHPDVFDFRRYACLGFAELYFIGVRLFGQAAFG